MCEAQREPGEDAERYGTPQRGGIHVVVGITQDCTETATVDLEATIECGVLNKYKQSHKLSGKIGRAITLLLCSPIFGFGRRRPRRAEHVMNYCQRLVKNSC